MIYPLSALELRSLGLCIIALSFAFVPRTCCVATIVSVRDSAKPNTDLRPQGVVNNCVLFFLLFWGAFLLLFLYYTFMPVEFLSIFLIFTPLANKRKKKKGTKEKIKKMKDLNLHIYKAFKKF